MPERGGRPTLSATVGEAALPGAQYRPIGRLRQVDRNLISRSIGIDPLYGRRMVGGRVMENETMLHVDVYNGLTAYEIFAMALDNDNLDELLVVLQDLITKIWTHEIEDDLFVNAPH
jgi:hypothetical protein